jgi:hypothetical protein
MGIREAWLGISCLQGSAEGIRARGQPGARVACVLVKMESQVELPQCANRAERFISKQDIYHMTVSDARSMGQQLRYIK